MNEVFNITNPEEYIATASISEIIRGIDNIVSSYKEYKIVDTMEATKRLAIRENAKIQIVALEEATKRELKNIDSKYNIYMELIKVLNNLLQNRDVLDDRTEGICLTLINDITNW